MSDFEKLTAKQFFLKNRIGDVLDKLCSHEISKSESLELIWREFENKSGVNLQKVIVFGNPSDSDMDIIRSIYTSDKYNVLKSSDI